MGEVHPLVVESFDIHGEWPILAAELDLEIILDLIPGRHEVLATSPFPAVLEDIAVIVDMSVPAGEVAQTINRVGGPLLKIAEQSVKRISVERGFDGEYLHLLLDDLSHALARTMKDAVGRIHIARIV